MGLIQNCAQFKPCPHCGMHGHIVFADGTQESVKTKFEGGLLLIWALSRRKITPEEAEFVAEKIYTSNMAPTPLESDLAEEDAELDELVGAMHAAKERMRA